jgi:hypothetical protein
MASSYTSSILHRHPGLNAAITAVVEKADGNQRTVFANREAAEISRRFPDIGVSRESIAAMIVEACTMVPGTSVEIGE